MSRSLTRILAVALILGASLGVAAAAQKKSKVPCDSWDVKLVDEDKDVCVVEDVNMCADNETWIIDSKSLLACQGSNR